MGRLLPPALAPTDEKHTSPSVAKPPRPTLKPKSLFQRGADPTKWPPPGPLPSMPCARGDTPRPGRRWRRGFPSAGGRDLRVRPRARRGQALTPPRRGGAGRASRSLPRRGCRLLSLRGPALELWRLWHCPEMEKMSLCPRGAQGAIFQPRKRDEQAAFVLRLHFLPSRYSYCLLYLT